MNRLQSVFVVAGLLASPAVAQRITVEKAKPDRVVEVHTSMAHVTVIEAGEPVLEVATGNAGFKIQWRGNKVFVEPTEEHASTNLLIWTASGLFNYELEPPGEVRDMDFAIVDPPADPPSKVAAETPVPGKSIVDMLLSERVIRLNQPKKSKKKVEVEFEDEIRDGDRLVLRFAIRNRGDHAYLSRSPSVVALNISKSSSLPPATGACQLDEQEAKRLKVSGQTSVEVLSAEIRSERLEPGQESLGVVAVRLPPTAGAHVLRFYFPASSREQVAATLVL